MNYGLITDWITLGSIIGLVVFLMVSWYYLTYFVMACIRVKKLPAAKNYTKFAVLIPARNESKVIRGILECFKNMKYPREFFDVFVIIESTEDPTYEIVKEYGFQCVVRGDLTNRKTKGFALDDAYHYIKDNNLKFDAFMVFDADNIVSNDYLYHMNNVYQAGYKVGNGYRNFTNASKNWLTAGSAVLFSYINQFTSRGRSLLFDKANLTGTGYFLAYEIVDNEGGWIWNGMTEDVQLTTYCYYHNIKMHYYPYAVYYDEQAESFKVNRTQHCRWVWGFFLSRERYTRKENYYGEISKTKRFLSLFEYNVSIYPFITISVIYILCFLVSIIIAIIGAVTGYEQAGFLFAKSFFQLFLMWFVFAVPATITIAVDNKHLKFSFWRSVSVILTYIIYFYTFALGFFDGLFNKSLRTDWKPIAHKGDVTNDEIKK